MSLDYKLDKIRDYETVCWEAKGQMNPTTRALIFYTRAVGLGEIADKNVGEWCFRLKLLARLDDRARPLSPLNHCLDVPTVADLRRHIGLTTNATNETRAAWLRRTLSFTVRVMIVAAELECMRELEGDGEVKE